MQDLFFERSKGRCGRDTAGTLRAHARGRIAKESITSSRPDIGVGDATYHSDDMEPFIPVLVLALDKVLLVVTTLLLDLTRQAGTKTMLA